MPGESDHKSVRDSFLQLEDDMNLFSVKIHDVHIWEWLRTSTYRSILRKKGVTGEGRSSIDTDTSQRLHRMIKNLFIKNPFLSRQRDILFIGSPRRKQKEDGYWWDVYCDPITTELDLDYLHLEPPYGRHRTPAKTKNIRYTDLIDYSVGIPKRLSLSDLTFTTAEEQKIQNIAEAFEIEFDVRIDFEKKIRDVLTNRRYKKSLYKMLLRRVDPKIVVVVAKSGNSVRIEACKEEGIPVVELQHGVIHEMDLKHDFPDDVEVNIYPDYLLTFGEYWCDCVNYPIDENKVIPVGYPYLEMESAKYADVNDQEQILFISQGTIGEELSKFAVELSERTDEYRIIYKQHPKEYNSWRNKYPWLEDADVRVIDGNEPSLYHLFAESEIQVGVYSTAIYEGLYFELDTYILDLPMGQLMETLLESEYATLVDSVGDLLKKIQKEREGNDIDTEYFFESNAVENILAALDEIRSKENEVN